MSSNKRAKKILIITICAILIFIIILLLLLKSCGQNDTGQTPSETNLQSTSEALENIPDDIVILDPEDGIGEIVDKEDFDINDFAIEESFPKDCMQSVKLYIADVYGKPLSISTEPDPNYEKEDSLFPIFPITITTPAPATITIQPTSSPPPSFGITVSNPKANSALTEGSSFTLEWTIESGRNITVDVLLSTDGGASFYVIEKGIANSSKLDLIIPNTVSNKCVFRVSAWVGTSFLGYNDSPKFSIIAAATPTPTPEVTPAPIPLEYISEDGAFILSTGDTVRKFYLEHTIGNVDHAVWQLSRTEFICGSDIEQDFAPGLLASGILTGSTQEFDIDFAAILSNYDAAENDTPEGTLIENKGVPFEIVPDIAISKQSQRVLFMRTILYDENNNIIGVTGSGLQVVYGRPSINIISQVIDSAASEYTPPILSAKTIPGFEPASYEEIPDQGLYIFKSDLFDKGFSLGGIPSDSVEIDFQISTMPFKSATQSDYQQPDGLVFQQEETNLTYTTVTKYYNVSFADFAPELLQLGDGTKFYYIRAVCYVPGNCEGTVIPIATKQAKIVFTGNSVVYFAGNFDPDDFPPEEVVVESYVPYVDFLRYIPVEWALNDSKEYFEVTRPIQAEEMAFYIKNNNTGDFLYPYALHKTLYPGTTREQYQEVLDRMLPEGAWFHLTINQSGWDAFWSDFFGLLSQIYSSVQKAYSDLKITIANTVADRFAFLGSDVQSVIRSSVKALIDYGLASVGLPPSLPNFDELAGQGLDYCVRVALDETAKSMGVPTDEIPADVRNSIYSEVSQQLTNLDSLKQVNPLNVSYLKPATQAMYRPAYVDFKVFNPSSHDKASPSGTLTVSYYPPQKSYFKIYKYVCLPIPPLNPGDATFIRVYLTLGNTGLPVYKDYYWGNTGECEIVVTATFDVPDLETAAAQQGVEGESSLYPDSYIYDIDPYFEYRKINTPSVEIFD